jgi:hypothetical protein
MVRTRIAALALLPLLASAACAQSAGSAPTGSTSQSGTPPVKAALPTSIAAHPDWPKANPADVHSVNAILAALYDVISGPAGQPRDWTRMRSSPMRA